MEINFNLGSLKIVHTPLMDYFKKIQNNISSNLVLIRDEKKVATNFDSIDLLKKAQGTLKMIGLLGLVKVLQLCGESLNDIKDVKFDTAKSIKVLEACEHLFKNITLYLDILLIGEMDQPTKFFSEYENLAKLTGKMVSIKDIFTPKLDVKEDMNVELQADIRLGLTITQDSKQSILFVVKNAQTLIEKNIANVTTMLHSENLFKTTEEKNEYNNSCKEIYKILNDVQDLKISKHVYVLTGIQKLFVCVTSPIFNDEMQKVLSLGVDTIVENFKNIEKSLNGWVKQIEDLEDGDCTGVIKCDDEITKEILYFLITVLKNNFKLKDMPVYKDLELYFNFEFYIEQLDNSELISTVVQKNPEIVIQIDKLFLDVKEELTLITSKQTNSEDFLVQHTTKFITFNQKLNEALLSVNTKELSGILNALNAIFGKIKNKELKFSESLQKEVSLAVVLVEYGINTFIKSVVKEADRTSFSTQVGLQQKRLLLAATGKVDELLKLAIPVLDEKSKKSDERKAFLKIFQELSKEFLKAEAVLDQFLRNPEDGLEEIKEVFKSLKSARGIFAVMGKPELSAVVVEIIKVWEKILKDGIASIDKELLNNSIAWLSGISLIIAAAKDDNELEANEVTANLLPKFNAYFKRDMPKADVKETVIEKKIDTAKLIANPATVATIIEPAVQLVSLIKVQSSTIYEDIPNDADLTEIYLMEAEEVLENMAVSLKAIHGNISDTEEITNVRRYFHTLKGSGKMVGLKYLGEAGWIAEQTLNKVLSGDLSLSEELFQAIKFSESQFQLWVNELKAHNLIAVDLIRFKKEFAKINPHLTTTFEIPDEVVSAHVDEVVKKVVESVVEKVITIEKSVPKVEVVLIGDKEISSMLYNMFVEESTNHMQAMNAFVHNEKNLKGTLISSDFMLHAHTLASIARTVNLIDCAKIASKIELIANLAIEKNIGLNGTEMQVLSHAVDNLEKFNSVASGVQVDQNYVNSLITNLTNLQESISNRNSVPAKQNAEIDIETLVERLSVVLKSIEPVVNPVLDMNTLVEALSVKLAPMLKQVTQETPTAQVVDIKALTESVTKSLKFTIEESVVAIQTGLKASLHESINKINAIVKSSLEDNVAKINKIHSDFKFSIDENVNNVNKSNAQFKLALEENVKHVTKLNSDLKISLESNVGSVNKELTTSLNQNIQNIQLELNTSLKANVEEVNKMLKNMLDNSSEKVSSSLKTVFENNLSNASKGMNELIVKSVGEVKTLTNELTNKISLLSENKPEIDIGKIATEVLNKVKPIMENQYSEMSKIVAESKYNTKEVVDELFNKIEGIEININQMKQEQKEDKKEVFESVLNIPKDIEGLIEKPSNTKSGFFKGLFGK